MTIESRLPALIQTPSKPVRGQRDLVMVAALIVLGVIVGLAVAAPLIAPYDPAIVDVYAVNQGPSASHLLGTDGLGRDVLSRLLYGGRTSLSAAAAVTAIATVAGTAIALLSAWRGGLVDRVLARVLDVVFAFPALLLAILAVVALGAGPVAPIAALAVAYTPYVARVVRSAAVTERHMPYIESFQLLGFSSVRTVFAHLLRNLRLLIGTQAAITYAYALLDFAAISFIGLGVQPPSSEWGLMVANGTASLLNGNGQESLAAGGMIVLTVLAINVVGERLAARVRRTA